VVTAPARRELMRQMVNSGLSERSALAVVRMSAKSCTLVRPSEVLTPICQNRPEERVRRQLSEAVIRD
jgi:hypothetical protein